MARAHIGSELAVTTSWIWNFCSWWRYSGTKQWDHSDNCSLENHWDPKFYVMWYVWFGLVWYGEGVTSDSTQAPYSGIHSWQWSMDQMRCYGQHQVGNNYLSGPLYEFYHIRVRALAHTHAHTYTHAHTHRSVNKAESVETWLSFSPFS